MSDASAFGFGKFIPGFDFLHSLGKAGSTTGGLPSLANWVAPTMSVEDVEKRIEELKAVQFWLEQNGRALAATVQALEVQRMTLSTLQSMNVNMAEAASAYPFAATAPAASAASPGMGDALHDWPLSAKPPASEPNAAPAAAQEVPSEAPETAVGAPQPSGSNKQTQAQADAPGVSAALQWWGALTQQFQHIAQQALQDPAQQQAMLQATQASTVLAHNAMKAASDLVRQATATTGGPMKAAPAAERKSAAPSSKPQKKTPAPRKTSGAVKKAVLADKKAAPVAVKKKAVAAKKPSTSKATRSR